MQTNQIIKKLTKALEERDALFPKRISQNTEECRKGLEAFYKIIQESTDEFQIDPQLVQTADQFANSPIIICGSMKSGTTLFLELLDNHKNLVALPGDSGLVSLYQQKSYQNFENWKFHWMKRFINPRGQSPFWLLGKEFENYFNFYKYLEYFSKNIKGKFKKFTAVALAYYCANPNRPINPKYWIEKNPDNEFHIETIRGIYPKAKIINVVRNPLNNCASLKKLSEIANYIFSPGQIKANYLETLKQKESNNFYIVSYEALLENTKEELQRISSWLGIEFNETLLIPTSNGLETKPNSMFLKEKEKGKIIRSEDHYQKILSDNEISLITNEILPLYLKIIND